MGGTPLAIRTGYMYGPVGSMWMVIVSIESLDIIQSGLICPYAYTLIYRGSGIEIVYGLVVGHC